MIRRHKLTVKLSAAIRRRLFFKMSKHYTLDLQNYHVVQGIHTGWGTPSLQPFAACCPLWGHLGPYREDRHGAWSLPARHRGPSYLVKTRHVQWSRLAGGASDLVSEVVTRLLAGTATCWAQAPTCHLSQVDLELICFIRYSTLMFSCSISLVCI